LVFVAGQVAEDGQGILVGPDDMAVQARQAFANVGRALAASGAGPEQVTKITIFVVDYQDAYLPAIEQGRAALFGDHKPADALVGVETLSKPEYLIEVEAIAVLDG
jgi:enamine deaminase RidA (YjgF/YER057c/UK114 family)